MKKIFFLCIYTFMSVAAWSQQVTNVDFTTEGKYIHVTYSITGVKKGQKFDITLWYTENGSASKQVYNNYLTGDFGTITASADGNITGKKITWNVLASREKLIARLKFEVRVVVTDPNNTPANMVLIKAGTFTMGSPTNEVDRIVDRETQHQVTLTYNFYMGKYEVTQAEYQSLMGKNPSKFNTCSNCPVELVTWWDAIKYCNALSKKEGLSVAYNESTGELLDASGRVTTDITKVKGYRLPTDAEWEYSCRAGTNTPFNTGNNLTTSQANYDGNYPYNGNTKGEYRQKTTSVGSFSPNTWGLYDMHGNVWEWCNDWYVASLSTSTNPIGASSGTYRVYRGGSWRSDARYCRSAYRNGNTPTLSDYGLGLRVCKTY